MISLQLFDKPRAKQEYEQALVRSRRVKKYCIMRSMTYNFSITITEDENGTFVGRVPAIRGCHTQAKSLTQLYKRLWEVIALCIHIEKERRPQLR